MNFTGEELKKLVLPVVAGLLLLGAGAALIWFADRSVAEAKRSLAAAQTARAGSAERLARIAEEEREVKQKLEVYRRLQELKVLGEERRLEWADTITRIRTQRELLDLRYRVERQKLLTRLPGKPADVEFYASPMRVEMALLHEGDLLRFLADLRDSGNAYYAVKKCSIGRTGTPPAGATIAPRLRAECEIDLITILDRAAKS